LLFLLPERAFDNVENLETAAHIRIDIGNSVIMTSSITNEAVDELGLRAGDSVTAVIKASDVMIGK
jgi:molybdopterin-binding protein